MKLQLFLFVSSLAITMYCHQQPSHAANSKVISHDSGWHGSVFATNKNDMLFDGKSLFLINRQKMILEAPTDIKLVGVERVGLTQDKKLFGIKKTNNKSTIFLKNQTNFQTISLPKEFDSNDKKNLSISINLPNIVVLKGNRLYIWDKHSWKIQQLKGLGFPPNELESKQVYKTPQEIMVSNNFVFLSYNTHDHYGGALSKYDLKTGVEKLIYEGGGVTSMVLDKSGALWFTTSFRGLSDLESELYKYQNEKIQLISYHNAFLLPGKDSNNPDTQRFKIRTSINWKFAPTDFIKLKINSEDKLFLLTNSEGVFQINDNTLTHLGKPWNNRKIDLVDFMISSSNDIVLLELHSIEVREK
ncbi:MAG: hypothetical protein KIT34_15400 [Cyanobacteria bacterium TGS_CYA1]|nr:hypothetical protein [Cyanobacteria bacterium TGS_CYA1]